MENKKQLTIKEKLDYFVFEFTVRFSVEKNQFDDDYHDYEVHVYLRDIMNFMKMDTKNEVAVNTAYQLIQYMDMEQGVDFSELFGEDESFIDFIKDEKANEAQRDYDCGKGWYN